MNTHKETDQQSPAKAQEASAFFDSTKPYQGVAVLGSNAQTIDQAPWSDPAWYFMACSPHNIEHRSLPVVHEWFEIHLPIQDRTRGYHYLRQLENYPFVWMRDLDAMPYFHGANLYPEEDYKRTFCPFMFTSSIAFILARAIMFAQEHKIPQIGIWGVMQASENEYTYQRPGIQYFIWEAERRGIEVIAPRESNLFEPPAEKF